jgi:geranylgeranylglycerol-phosphate geranylgeranyltransferase
MGDPAAYIRIMRPVNSLMMGFAVLVGAVIGGGSEIFGSTVYLALAFVTGFAFTGSAMAINDYYDREIDAINEPQRPIPSGAMTPGEALAESLALSAVGFASSWGTGLNSLALAAVAWVTMMYYATAGKKTGLLGNFLVSFCVALPIIYGGVMAGSSGLGGALIFASIVFFTNTGGREITKGIVDMEGDRENNVGTVAVRSGAGAAAWASIFCYISAVAISYAPVHFGIVTFWYSPFVAFTDLGLIYLSYSLMRDHGRENSRRVKNGVRVLMMCGLVGFLLGNLL